MTDPKNPLDSKELHRRGVITAYNIVNEMWINEQALLEQRPDYHPETRQVTTYVAEMLEKMIDNLDFVADQVDIIRRRKAEEPPVTLPKNEKGTSQLCRGRTEREKRDGFRCRRRTLHPSGFCPQHRNQRSRIHYNAPHICDRCAHHADSHYANKEECLKGACTCKKFWKEKEETSK